MKIEIKENCLVVMREDNDPKHYGNTNAAGESRLLHAIKKELNKQGYDLIKKRMWKDGHLVSDYQQYLRTRKKGAGVADIAIYNSGFAIKGAEESYNKNGKVILALERDIFK